MLHIPSALFYGTMSIMMVFGNKYLLSNLHFNNPIFLILAEMILNIVFILTLNHLVFKDSEQKINTNVLLEFFQKPADFKYHLLVALFYCAHSVLSLKALNGLNIPMYVMFKRCTPLVNLFISYFVLKNFSLDSEHHKKIVLSVIMITIGVIIAGIGDLDPDLESYLYCFSSVGFQAAYLSSIQMCGEYDEKQSKKTSSLHTLFECSVFSIPLLLALFLATDEYKNVQASFNISFIIVIISVIGCGSLLCFSQFWCTLKNNAVTTSVLGVLKSIVQTLAGMVFFMSFSDFSNLTILGICLNLVSGIWYTYLKYIDKKSTSNKHENI